MLCVGCCHKFRLICSSCQLCFASSVGRRGHEHLPHPFCRKHILSRLGGMAALARQEMCMYILQHLSSLHAQDAVVSLACCVSAHLLTPSLAPSSHHPIYMILGKTL